MYILGLESSCDETACALVRIDLKGRLIVESSVISSQIIIHNQFGGVVPEVASRQHILHLLPVITETLERAGLSLGQVDGIAVTRGPGLVGALLVAVQTAKAIAYSYDLPLIGVHHLEGHLLAIFLQERNVPISDVPPIPHIAVLVSGGHTCLVHVETLGNYHLLGCTRDDAAGEAFDKVGKMLGLGYPAGPTIEHLSKTGGAGAISLPKPMLSPKAGLDFSFSGLKTKIANCLREDPVHGVQKTADVCASFQAAVVEQVVRKVAMALDRIPAQAVVLSGGVACNRVIRAGLAGLCQERKIQFFVPPPHFCTDNAAMIAAAGYYRLQRGERAEATLNAIANLSL